MSLFVIMPLRKVIKIMIAKLIKMIKRLILMMVKEMLKMKLKKDDKNVLNTGIATLNLGQQNPVLLETAQACVETPDGKRSEL